MAETPGQAAPMELSPHQKLQMVAQRRQQVAAERYNHHLTKLMLQATASTDDESRQAMATAEEAIRLLTAADRALAQEAARVAEQDGGLIVGGAGGA